MPNAPEESPNKLLQEVKRLLSEGRERDVQSFLQRQGEESLAGYLHSILAADSSDAWALDQACRAVWNEKDEKKLAELLEAPVAGLAAVYREAWQVLLIALQRGKNLHEKLAELVCRPEPLADFPTYLERELQSLRVARVLDLALEEAVEKNTVGMSFAALHVRRVCHRKQWSVREHFPAWIERAGDRAEEPVSAFLHALGEAREAAEILPPMLEQQGEWMKRQTNAYGKAGFALLNSGLTQETARWLDGCEARDDLACWLAANQVRALLLLSREAEAGAVADGVLKRAQPDHAWNWHASAGAYVHALSGRLEPALTALALIKRELPLPSPCVWMEELAKSMTRVQKLPKSESKRLYMEECARLRNLAQRSIAIADEPLARHQHGIALEAMARQGGFGVRMWHRRLQVKGARNPLRGKLWVAGTILLIAAMLRACWNPSQRGAVDQMIEEQKQPKTKKMRFGMDFIDIPVESGTPR
jgi:hypothetical protein